MTLIVPPGDPLDSAWRKLQWANQHLDRLDAEIQEFLAPEPYRIETDIYTEAIEFVVKLKVLTPPPEHLGFMIGDVVQNLRASLDHAICGLVVNVGGSCEPPVGFPVNLSESGYDGSSGRTMPGLDEALIAFIKGLQPFRAIGNPDNELLYQLHRLAIIDRHRNLVLAATAFEEAELRFSPVLELVDPGLVARGPLEDGAVIARLRKRTHAPVLPYMYVKFDLPPTVGFGKGSGPATGAPVVEMLKGTAGFIAYILGEIRDGTLRPP